ncbi:hypothetical protein V6Z11_A04G171400 [Gossypium hirsutum]
MEFPKKNSVNKTGSEGVGTADIIIVGAGVAGAALAYSLGKDGRRVRAIERDLNAPNRMACESLIPGGYLKLIELGLEDCVDEIGAQRLLGYTLYKDGKEAHVSFPLEKSQSHVAGRTFHNGRFVQSLRKKVASLHNVSLEQGTVTSLIEENGIVKGVQYKSESGQVLTADASLTIICDGCFSNLRRSLCSPKVDIPSYFVGFILTNCNLPIKNYGAIIVAHPSPIVFSPISSTEIRCMVNVPSEQVPSVSNGEMACYLKTQVAPKVLPELYDSFISAIEKKVLEQWQQQTSKQSCNSVFARLKQEESRQSKAKIWSKIKILSNVVTEHTSFFIQLEIYKRVTLYIDSYLMYLTAPTNTNLITSQKIIKHS